MHIPVLLNEVLQYLEPKPGENFIDCTYGEGGHALAILRLVAPNGKVLGIDRDAAMIKISPSDRLILHHGNFADIRAIAAQYDFASINGILFDFGLSSWQLEESGAGFSFQNIEPLDMRFDRSDVNSETAASIVNSWREEAIAQILYEFGEERYARRIAREIIQARKKERIARTDQLVRIILRAVPKRSEIHCATRTFQALRIAVNNELENIEKGLHEAIGLLSWGGRICAISFHSLEDRRVKNIFKEYAKEGSLKILTKKPMVPSEEERRANPRARSAKLRWGEKLKQKSG